MLIILFVTMRLLFGTLFLIAGIRKLWNVPKFYLSIVTFEILPAQLSKLLAWVLPVLEAITSIALICGIKTRIVACIVIGLLCMFSAAFIIAWLHQREVSCGCLGESSGSTSYLWALIRNAALFALALGIVFTPSPIQDLTLVTMLHGPEVVAFLIVLFLLVIGSLFLMLRRIWESSMNGPRNHAKL
jgi:putative oxidoreductase